MGEPTLAKEQADQGITLCETEELGFRDWPGAHPEEQCLLDRAWCLWSLGYPDQALRDSQAALTSSLERAHPFSLACALGFSALLHLFRGETGSAHDQAEKGLALSTEQKNQYYAEMARIIHGRTLTMAGQDQEGIAQMRQGIIACQDMQAALWVTSFHAVLAEAYDHARQAIEALAVLAEGLKLVETTGERFCESELHRLKGKVLVRKTDNDASQAEQCFHQALEVAQRQQTKSLELRAATSLARLWQGQGKAREARDLLEPIYSWFTEGFDTADLKDAKALLEELR